MTIYTVVMLLFTVTLTTVQEHWTIEIYIQGVTRSCGSNTKHKTNTKHDKMNVFCW